MFRKFLSAMLGILIFLSVALPVAGLVLVLEKTAITLDNKALAVEDAGKVKSLATRAYYNLYTGRQTAGFHASEDELNAFLAFATRGLTFFSGHLGIDDAGLAVVMSFETPDTPWGRFINVRIHVLPSDRGLHIQNAAIGRLNISGRTARIGLEGILNLVFGRNQGNEILDSLHSIQFKKQTAYVWYSPLPDLDLRFDLFKKRLQRFRQMASPFRAPKDIRVYYTRLVETEAQVLQDQVSQGQAASLADFLPPLFELATQRSKTGSPVEENRAALLALSVYTGHWRFEQFTGKISTPPPYSNSRLRGNIRLADRRDLCLHFVVSAGIKVLSDAKVSFVAGEFKELLDAMDGGSGFSFDDLAADRAGTFFARMATADDASARQLQQRLKKGIRERDFFPDMAGLPRGMSQARFQKVYGSLESQAYAQMVDQITETIMALPFYRNPVGPEMNP